MNCFACYDGFYPDSNGDCVACSGNCEICIDDKVCFECSEGYVLEIASETDSLTTYGTECVACDPRCKTCVFETDICSSCPDEYKLNGTTCIGLFVVAFEF